MKKLLILIIAVAVALIAALLFNTSATAATTTSFETILIEQILHQRVNETRVEHGLQETDWNETLWQVTKDHSDDMNAHGYFSHKNLQEQSPLDRAWPTWEGTTCSHSLGENLALIWTEREDGILDYVYAVETAISMWLASSQGHRENMLDGSWVTTGIGVSVGEGVGNHYPVFITQNFCR